jgi:hypothetical protein
MVEQTGRFGWVSRLAQTALIVTLIWLMAVLALYVASDVLTGQQRPGDKATLIINAIASFESILKLGVTGLWAVVAYGVVLALVTGQAEATNAAASAVRVETLLEAEVNASNKLIDLATLSDDAKSLIYRDREVEAFGETFHDMVLRQDYKGAKALVDSIETKFGYAGEAANLRAELETTQKATLEEKINAGVGRIMQIIQEHNWTRASREIQRLVRLFPENLKIAALPQTLESAKAQHKRSLLQEYGEAVKKNDVDRGIELLKQLDRYLSPQEGAALEESARGVFKAKLHNLGVQFAINVTDRQWAPAIATGNEIIREFPNTRMAYEVRQKMDQLQVKAAERAGA